MFFFFKQKTAYELRISDWSSDVCSSDLARLFGLREQKILDDRLAPAGRADDERLPDVAIVEIEIIGRIGGRLEQRDRVAPMMARALAHGIGVDRRERGEIARGQGSGPRPPREIAGELRPVSRLQRQILAGRDNSAFGESGARDRHILRQNIRRFSNDRQPQRQERKSVGWGKSGSASLYIGGC